MPTATLTLIAIEDFADACGGKSPEDVADYCNGFYTLVGRQAERLGFSPVKCLGGAVLLVAPPDERANTRLYEAINVAYPVRVAHRECRYARAMTGIGDYRCHDVFGADVEHLIEHDGETTVVG